MNILLKRLNNDIIAWENIYGDWYTMLYDESGKQRPEHINEDSAYQALREAGTILSVLKNLKRNRYYLPKKLDKRKYKLTD